MMKIQLTIAALGVASLLSFGANAASMVTNQQAQDMNSAAAKPNN